MSRTNEALAYRHVDVFSDRAFAGNGLCVFLDVDLDSLGPDRMLAIAREMRQFESIFLATPAGDTVIARVFTEDEELPFAGHPVLGAAAVLHREHAPEREQAGWSIMLGERAVDVRTALDGGRLHAEMDQGAATTLATLDPDEAAPLVSALTLSAEDLHDELALQVLTTGLPYLIVPVRQGLERAAIRVGDFEELLAEHDAKFVYVFDPDAREGRTWDNNGRTEDVATGSAAGPAAAYLLNHRRATPAETIHIRQGRFLGRPSTMSVRRDPATEHLLVGGIVTPVARAVLTAPASLPAR